MAAPAAPRVLLEARDPVAAAALARALRSDGLEVDICRGPHRLPEAGCPILIDGDCSMVARADVVLFDLDLDEAAELAVLEATRARYADKPVVVEASSSVARRHASALAGCRVVPPISPEYLSQSVLTLLDNASV